MRSLSWIFAWLKCPTVRLLTLWLIFVSARRTLVKVVLSLKVRTYKTDYFISTTFLLYRAYFKSTTFLLYRNYPTNTTYLLYRDYSKSTMYLLYRHYFKCTTYTVPFVQRLVWKYYVHCTYCREIFKVLRTLYLLYRDYFKTTRYVLYSDYFKSTA